MGFILFLTKPLLYLAAFTAAAFLFRRYGPHWTLSPVAVVFLATATRLGGGVASGVVSTVLAAGVGASGGAADGASTGRDLLPFLVIFGVGFVLWLGVAKVAFRQTPRGLLVVFAAAAEMISGGIDYWAIQDFKSLQWHIC